MATTDGSTPAYPLRDEKRSPVTTGLTKREAMAMHAMQSLLGSESYKTREEYIQVMDILAEDAVRQADALLTALAKEKTDV